MQTVRSHNIELKEVTEPLNELDVRAQGVKGFFYCLKIKIIIIMAKIILNDGVINVKESYDEIKTYVKVNSWINLTTENPELKSIEKATGIEQDYRIYIQVKNIQCIKP